MNWASETKTVYRVAYVNWLGVWVTTPTVYASKANANRAMNKIAKSVALNGQATVWLDLVEV